ncbi:TetR/AcrR family transcriptional regulator [Micromonospora sp. ATA51]|nr:TetR/AcrR family transcriptional regulator [Micromonospora sp. ATA51]MBM0225986.1 TetR/AcrR family transcriptional regulator [Micromonospora sp. ATA51]
MSNERLEKILAAAYECFTRHGVRRTTMDDIAAAAGMSRPAVYQYVRNKDDAYRRLAERLFAGSLADARQAAEAPGADLTQRLHDVLAAKLELTLRLHRESRHAAELLDTSTRLTGDLAEAYTRELTDVVAGTLADSAAPRARAAADVLVALTRGLEATSPTPTCPDGGCATVSRWSSRASPPTLEPRHDHHADHRHLLRHRPGHRPPPGPQPRPDRLRHRYQGEYLVPELRHEGQVGVKDEDAVPGSADAADVCHMPMPDCPMCSFGTTTASTRRPSSRQRWRRRSGARGWCSTTGCAHAGKPARRARRTCPMVSCQSGSSPKRSGRRNGRGWAVRGGAPAGPRGPEQRVPQLLHLAVR